MNEAGGMGATLVLGLGNPILGDDGVGWRVAELIESRLAGLGRAAAGRTQGSPFAGVEVDRLSLGGLRLMERLVGYEHAVLVDAIVTGERPAGTIRCLRLDELADPGAGHTGSAHDASLCAAMTLGRLLGAELPTSPWVVAVEAERISEVGEELSPAVAAAVPVAADAVLALLAGNHWQRADGGAERSEVTGQARGQPGSATCTS